MTSHLPKERFLRHYMIIMLVCAMMLFGIGIFMYIENGVSSGYMWPRFTNPKAVSITWHTPIFAGLLCLFITVWVIFGDRPKKQTVKEMQPYVLDEIKYFMQKEGFRKRGCHFFKRNGEVGYCVNIQNDKSNDTEQIRFTLNVGIFTDNFWLKHLDLKHTGIIPSFPKEYDCAIRKRIGELLSKHEDKWYYINSNTDVDELWECIEGELIRYVMPFFANYDKESDVMSNQLIYNKGK